MSFLMMMDLRPAPKIKVQNLLESSISELAYTIRGMIVNQLALGMGQVVDVSQISVIFGNKA